jgi:hypothetical protein
MSWSTQGFWDGMWRQDSGNTEGYCLDGEFAVKGAPDNCEIWYGTSDATFFRGCVKASSEKEARKLLKPFNGLEVQGSKYGGVCTFTPKTLTYKPYNGEYMLFCAEGYEDHEESFQRLTAYLDYKFKKAVDVEEA